ncbi:polysaccharide deacetylase [Halalkalicoccus paucihalophilus]|uniref:Polysaccharide deacetylase n=1 Tax=Halalkalicoccus paucihalophilus TaxID=1008153 RepID=A0A151AAN1_9EURY|nr:polysaccharide deacetylase family protein [Halalkalicoccus paucihalophilus]KYH24610.1 polysaccharide deacetylase [Halalkalicoccus paucihalophilus]
MTLNRRALLATVGVTSVAGCLGQLDQLEDTDPDQSESTQDDNEADDQTEDTHEKPDPESYDPLFDFHDLTAWESSGGELTADQTERITGEHAARIDVSVTKPWARVERAGLDLDLSNHRLNLVCQLHLSDTQGESVDIVVEDHQERQLRFRSRIHKTGDDTTFMPVDLGVREWEPAAMPDLSSIRRIQIQSRFGEDTSGSLWLDSLDVVELPETPKLMIQWDDGFVSQYTEGLPIQRKYDIPSNTFINPTNVDTGDDRLTLEQLEELQAAGWEISSHLLYHDHLTELDVDEQETQIRESKEWLIEHGFERGAEYFAYPFGEHDQSSYDLIGKHHSLAMIGGEPGYGLPRNFPALGRSSERTFEAATEYVDLLIEWGGFGGLFWHAIPGETPVDEFDAIMSYIADRRDAGELDVLTLSELDEIAPPVPEVMPWYA